MQSSGMNEESNGARPYRIHETMGLSVGPGRSLTPKELAAARRRIERLERRPGYVVDVGHDGHGAKRH
jgi:hypothetical protein